MKNFLGLVGLAVLGIWLGLLSGCTSVGIDGREGAMAYNAPWSSASPKDAAEAYRTVAMTNVEANDREVFRPVDVEIRRNRGAAETRVIEAQAKILSAYAERLNPAGGDRLKALLDERERLWAELLDETDPDRKEELNRALEGTTTLILHLLETHGAPAGYIGGVGGLPLIGGGVPVGVGAPVPAIVGASPAQQATNASGYGAFVNRMDRKFMRVWINGQVVGTAGPGQPIPVIVTPDVPTNYTAEAIEGGQVVGIYTGTVTPDPNRASGRDPFRWTEEIPGGVFRRP